MTVVVESGGAKDIVDSSKGDDEPSHNLLQIGKHASFSGHRKDGPIGLPLVIKGAGPEGALEG